MKANELMIGDCVIVAHGGNTTHYAKITALLPNGIIECNLDECDVLCKSVEPIPLTPEILEKNKLLKHDRFELDFSRHHRLKVILLWTDAKGISRPQITFYLPKPQYVHELQHALRLCGIEKEFEL